MNYYIEYTCPKCGAPMGFNRTTEQAFKSREGSVHSDPVEHTDDEIGDVQYPMQVKLIDRTCSACHEW